MDELAAAAAAVGTTTETNADDGSEQHGPCGTVSVANASMEGVESTTEDKENNGGHAATGESGAGDPKAAVAVLLMKADLMFPEGHGAPRAFTRDGTAAKKTNELLENASAAIDKLFEQRGYDPKKPEQLKASLGYALDRYEATAYLVTGALHLLLLSPQEARAIGKRIANVIGMSGSVGAKLKALRKRGKAAAPQIAALLHAPATLNLEPPPRNSTASPAPPPAPPPPPVLLPPPAGRHTRIVGRAL